MIRKLITLFTIFLAIQSLNAQTSLAEQVPVRGFSIAAPGPSGVEQFVSFIENDLATRQINVLILRVDYNYQYKSHPELRDSIALSEQDVKKLVAVCGEHGIRIVPQINLLGHQSWAGGIGNLLKEYPEFDETPSVEMPDEYEWPNEDGFVLQELLSLASGRT